MITQWKTETKAMADLKPAAYNPRLITERAKAGLSNSMERYGLVQPIVWNKRTGNIVSGHQRYSILVKEGITETDVIVVDLDEHEEVALNITMNNTEIQGDFNNEMIGDMLRKINAESTELFETLRMDDLAESLRITLHDESGTGDSDPQVDKLEELQKKWGTQLGDLWIIGNHRLVCGDSTSPENVARLLDGAKPLLMVTDPPYGVEYDADWRNNALRSDGTSFGGRAVGKVMNDDRADWREAWALFPGDVAYVWHAGTHTHEVGNSLVACDFTIRALICWAKSVLVIGRGHYHHMHEPCFYAVRDGSTAHWVGDHKQTTLWKIDKPQKSETGHSTQKPLECMEKPMRNHDTESVYEPFCGSGTTMVAAQNLGRKCYASELNPQYVAVILQRMQDAFGITGTKA
jgi:DNA modification methylase